MNEWYPEADRNPAPSNLLGHWFPLADVIKGCLHSTESRGRFHPQNGTYFGHTAFPHFTVSRGRVWQHVPLGRASRALLNLRGGVETNNEDGVVQIEIDWQAADIANLPDDSRVALVALMRWVSSVTAIPWRFAEWHPYPPPVRLGTEPWRMQGRTWQDFAGWCGHQHVPENNHGDPGAIPTWWFADAPIPAPPASPILEDDDMMLWRYPDGRFFRTDGAGNRRPVAPAGLAQKMRQAGVPEIQLDAEDIGGFEAAFPDYFER